jgi:hypothetical protein
MLNAIDVTRLQLNDVAASIAPLVPQVDAAVRAAARGDLSASSATASRLALLDRQIVQTRLAQAIAEYEVALEIAVGRPLEAIQ